MKQLKDFETMEESTNIVADTIVSWERRLATVHDVREHGRLYGQAVREIATCLNRHIDKLPLVDGNATENVVIVRAGSYLLSVRLESKLNPETGLNENVPVVRYNTRKGVKILCSINLDLYYFLLDDVELAATL